MTGLAVEPISCFLHLLVETSFHHPMSQQSLLSLRSICLEYTGVQLSVSSGHHDRQCYHAAKLQSNAGRDVHMCVRTIQAD